jgi:Raf kinase inhibitor-like YbhB/YbcL family protein
MKAHQNQTNENGDTTTTEATMTLSSTAFKNDSAIPQRFSCQGEDISPMLTWSSAPEETKSFALVIEDPDAPNGTFIHWVIYNIPSSEHGLAENIARRDPLPNGARQGTNSAQQLGYMGPCPPAGKAHRYYFKLFALDTEINIPGEATHDKLMSTIQGHILAKGEIMGTYQKK